MKKMITIRFWNVANECINVGGRYLHYAETEADAWNMATALLKAAHRKGAVEMDMDNQFYQIIDD